MFRHPWLAGLVAAGLALGEALRWCGVVNVSVVPSLDARPNAFFAAASAGAFWIYLHSRPSWAEVGLLGVCAAALSPHHGSPIALGLHVAVRFGLLAIVVLLVRALATRGRFEELSLWLDALLLPALVALSGPWLDLTRVLHPQVFDSFAYAVDGMLGVQPAFIAGRLLVDVPALDSIARVAYVGLPVLIAVVHRADLGARDRAGGTIVVTAVIGALGLALYHVLPVVGPAFAFPDVWPSGVPHTSLVRPPVLLAGGTAIRNGMPSLHAAWALALWWQSAGHRPPIRVLAGLTLGLTLLATLGFGYHYVVDLVVAVPLTLAARGLAATGAEPGSRRDAFVVGASLTCFLLAAVRWPPSVGFVPAWACVAAVLMLCARLNQRLNATVLLTTAA